MKKFWAIVLLVFLGSLGPVFWGIYHPSPTDLVMQLPVLEGGRVKPLDTLARNFLLTTRGKQTVDLAGHSVSAQTWTLATLFRGDASETSPIFRIDDPTLLGIIGVEVGKKRYFSYRDIAPFFPILEEQSRGADEVEANSRTVFQRNLLRLRSSVSYYGRLKNTMGLRGQDAPFYVFPPLSGKFPTWLSFGDGVSQGLSGAPLHPLVPDWIRVAQWVQEGKLDAHVADLERTHAGIAQHWSPMARPVYWEWLFNQWSPFYTSMIVYLAAFCVVLLGWLLGRQAFQMVGFQLAAGAFGVHSLGIIIRMFLQGRPPVTNLYTSAVFVGWVAILLGLVLEQRSKRGFGTVVASVMGFLTLIIAHHLSYQGDTMEMMQAVLDSNFWLSTHVVTVTMGYGATFLAGFLAHLYLFRGIFSRDFTQEDQKTLTGMVFGVLCFALFFSFTGTVLGGIWADQSWGRFWGWDPKENGALMIVLWNAAILHARQGGIIRERGMMLMAIFGNIVTAFSWFGVNMLGVGLHSYGFMDKAFFWLVLFVFLEVMMIWLGSLPRHYWRNKP